MFWIILITIEFTYIMTEINEWDSAHSYYKREKKIAPQFNLKARTAHILTNLNLVYTSNVIIGAVLLIGSSALIDLLYSSGLFIMIPFLYLFCLVVTLLLVNVLTSIIDTMFNNHVQLKTLLTKQRSHKYEKGK